MALRFDESPTDVLVVCQDCNGAWRAGPFTTKAAALAAGSGHQRVTHDGNRHMANQLSLIQRRARARDGR